MKAIRLTFVFCALMAVSLGFAAPMAAQETYNRDGINWMKAPPISENDKLAAQFQIDQANMLVYVCAYYTIYTGKYPETLQEVYDAGFLFYKPFNYVKGEPIDLNGPKGEGGFSGEIWVEKGSDRGYVMHRHGPAVTYLLSRLDFKYDASKRQ